MAKLINNDDTLRQYLPNVFATVNGEVSLFDKVKVDIDLAENWVENTFTGDVVFEEICDENDPRHELVSKLVVTEAMRRTIPSLDLVLTPNGFGVVSTQNIAPASKERVERLIGSLADYRDECIANLLSELRRDVSFWIDSQQEFYFQETLFPDLAITEQVKGNGSKWERYLALRPKIMEIEASLAEEWFSPELLESVRDENLWGWLTDNRKKFVREVQAVIVAYLNEGTFNARRLADIVNFIRRHPADFEEWHNSETAKLFSPPVFRNLKTNKGYWF